MGIYLFMRGAALPVNKLLSRTMAFNEINEAFDELVDGQWSDKC